MGVWTVFYARIPAGIYLGVLMLNGVSLRDFANVQADSWYGLTFGSYYIYISQGKSVR